MADLGEIISDLKWRTERARHSPTAPLPCLTVANADILIAALETHDNVFADLTIDRLRSARDVAGEAWMMLDAIRMQYPDGVKDLPERLAVLEGLLQHTGDRVSGAMSNEQYEAWRVRRDAI